MGWFVLISENSTIFRALRYILKLEEYIAW
jgi:hypothetical protein